MTKSELINEMAFQLEVSKPTAANFFDVQAALAYDNAKDGFLIPGIGKLVLVDRKARMGRNPATGETIKIPAKKAVKFKVLKVCKESILPPKPIVKKKLIAKKK